MFLFSLYVVVTDLTFGTLRALKQGNFKSQIGLLGIVTHAAVLGIIYFTSYIGNKYNNAELATLIINTVFIANYATSIIANLELLGFPIPSWLKDLIKSEITNKRKGKK